MLKGAMSKINILVKIFRIVHKRLALVFTKVFHSKTKEPAY